MNLFPETCGNICIIQLCNICTERMTKQNKTQLVKQVAGKFSVNKDLNRSFDTVSARYW